jgi:hypothetical protein
LDGDTFDPFSFTLDFCAASAADVSRREIAAIFGFRAPVAVLERPIPALDPALRVGMQWRAANVPGIWRQLLLQHERNHQQDHSGVNAGVILRRDAGVRMHHPS